ncbi:hypothetical protein BKA64DRAFT_61977 [Cadophora sp. MPI-SDFR-AT-0126]|nr:hypothetical protein BKA64DRAFT_61977 [Leotiomycetes sp. MPI-SDFR-AT-0126]
MMFDSFTESASSVAPQQATRVKAAATTFTKIAKHMLAETPTNNIKPILNTEPPIRIPSIEFHGFKRIMTSSAVVDTASEISSPALFTRVVEMDQNNVTILNGTANPDEGLTASEFIISWVVAVLIIIIIIAVVMLVSTISTCLKARKKAERARREREGKDAEETRKLKLVELRHVRVELKDLGEIMRPERAT